jgi:hypothetical protein
MGHPHTAQFSLALLAAASFAPQLAFANAFPSYLVSVWALLAPALGIAAASWLDRMGRPALGVVLAALLAVGLAANAAAQWPRWIGSGAASVTAFRELGRALARRHGPDCVALTFETHLAVEAGCRVLPGLEYSLFSYFPELDTETARAHGVLDVALLREAVAKHPPDWVAVSAAHARILAGAQPERRAGRLVVPKVEPLEFLGPLAVDYGYRARLEVPSGAPHPGERDTRLLWLYERRNP